MNASINTNTAENSGSSKPRLWSRLPTHPRIPLLIALSAAFATLTALLLWLKSPDYQVLYSNIADRDGGAIVTQLTQMNIPYRFSENGSTLLIPAENVHETRLRLAQQGLPKGGAIGFELLDQEKFGISQFSEQINYQRALEGELSRTIESLGPVQRARVHLALPKPSLFVREQKSPSASVTLALAPGRTLDEGQINAVVHMVSGSVAGLSASNVTLVDQAGRLLTSPESAGRDLNATQLKYISEVEERYQRRIETLLAPIVGAANVRAQVTAQIDFATREQTDEQYQPNQPPDKSAVRSRQLSQSEQRGGQPIGGVPGALSNQPSPPASAPIEVATPEKDSGNTNTPAAPNGNTQKNAAVQSLTQQTRSDETTNYEVDRTIRHIQQKAGTIERLSVAVVINTLATDSEEQQPSADQASTSKPAVSSKQTISKEQLTQLESLVREAMGYSAKRGDTLNVVNLPFNEAALDAGGELPFWQKTGFIEQLVNMGRYLLVMLVAWLLWRKWVRPQLQSLQKRESLQKTERSAALAKSQTNAAPDKSNNDELVQRKKSQQRASAEVQSQRIRELADQEPRVVALVIHQWMSNEL